MNLSLRPFQDNDLDDLFDWERDPTAAAMAAFTREGPPDRNAFDAHYQRVRADPRNTLLAIESLEESLTNPGLTPLEDRDTPWLAR